MMKNKFIIFLLFNLIFLGGTWHKCLAQSEMDLLLEEKRNEELFVLLKICEECQVHIRGASIQINRDLL